MDYYPPITVGQYSPLLTICFCLCRYSSYHTTNFHEKQHNVYRLYLQQYSNYMCKTINNHIIAGHKYNFIVLSIPTHHGPYPTLSESRPLLHTVTYRALYSTSSELGTPELVLCLGKDLCPCTSKLGCKHWCLSLTERLKIGGNPPTTISTWPHPTWYTYQAMSWVRTSLIPRPDPPEKEGPDIHCLRMRLISQKSWENRGLLCYIHATMTSNFGYH